MWAETTTLYTQLHDGPDSNAPIVGAGVLTLGVGDLLRLLGTFHATNAESWTARACASATFGGFFARQLWRTYILKR
jgi:hypothetical protein